MPFVHIDSGFIEVIWRKRTWICQFAPTNGRPTQCGVDIAIFLCSVFSAARGEVAYKFLRELECVRLLPCDAVDFDTFALMSSDELANVHPALSFECGPKVLSMVMDGSARLLISDSALQSRANWIYEINFDELMVTTTFVLKSAVLCCRSCAKLCWCFNTFLPENMHFLESLLLLSGYLSFSCMKQDFEYLCI